MMLSFPLLLVAAVLLVIRKYNAAGVRCGIAGTLSLLAFSWFWFSGQARIGEHWYELAFGNPGTIALLAIGSGLTIANAVAYYRQKEECYFG